MGTLSVTLLALPNLEKLTLTGHFEDIGITGFSEVLQNSPGAFDKLKELTICGSFSDFGMTTLATALPQLKLLRNLVISGKFKDEGMTALANTISQLKDLNLLEIDGEFQDEGAKFLAKIFSQIHIRKLRINGWFQEPGVAALGENLPYLNYLTEFVLNAWIDEDTEDALLVSALSQTKDLSGFTRNNQYIKIPR